MGAATRWRLEGRVPTRLAPADLGRRATRADERLRRPEEREKPVLAKQRAGALTKFVSGRSSCSGDCMHRGWSQRPSS